MSRLPQVDKKPKNNKDNKFRWVDSQWEKLLTKQKELQDRLLELEMENAELRDKLIKYGEDPNQLSFDFEIANDKGNGDFEVNYGRRAGDKVREQFNRECD